jgi:hypothetical protein
VLLYEDVSIRPEELSTRVIDCNEGTASDCNFEAFKSGTRASRRGRFDLGALYGRLVSAPMTRWEAARWFSPERT